MGIIDSIVLSNAMIDCHERNMEEDLGSTLLGEVLGHLKELSQDENQARGFRRNNKNAKQFAVRSIPQLIGECYENPDKLIFLLAVNDDVQQTLARFDSLEKGVIMEPFISEVLQSYSIKKVANQTVPIANKKKEK